ncbi:MAG: hypothetical protein QOE90_1160 [Thermoplasmata archaeon]|jgi:MFS family permease|nr:hypothetical protein [Thermoplasmata archaeon]
MGVWSEMDPRVRWVVLGSFLTVAARMSTVTFLSIFFTHEVGLAAPLVGVGFLLENALRGATALPLGALSDRIGRRPVILASLVATAIVLPTFLLVRTPAELLLWSAASGLASGGSFGVVAALVIDLVPAATRQRALALNYSAVSVGYTLGVAPAGFLAERGYVWLAVMSGVGYALVALLYAVVLRGALPREPRPHEASFVSHAMRAPRDPAFLALVATCFVFPLGIGLTSSAAPLFGADVGLSDVLIGLLLSTNGVLLVLLAVPVATRLESSGPFRMLGLAAAFLALSYVALALLSPFWALLGGTTIFTLGELIFSSAMPTAVALLAPAGWRGAYQGAWSFVSAVCVGGALFLAGVLRDAYGWPRAWLAFAAVTAIAGIALLLLRARMRAIAEARGAA